MKIGIVVSETYWDDITSKMLAEAENVAKAAKIETVILKVPGSFDIPLPVKKLLQRHEIEGVVTLGAVLEGDTDHDKIISYTLAKTLQELALEFEKPVLLGVNGPKMMYSAALKRIPRAAEVMKAAIALIKTCRKLK